MSTSLKLFEHPSFGQVRTYECEGGEILFCGRDVAEALGYSNPSDALTCHCKGVVKRYPLETAGRTQAMRFIPESDLYRLIFSSKLPAAQEFEAWVTEVVLPSIRKTGMYATPQTVTEMLNDPEAFLELVQNYVKQQKELSVTRQLLAEAKPKLTYYDIVLKSKSLMTVTQIAKDFGLSAKKLNRLLEAAGVQFKQSGQWQLKQTYAVHGYTQSETYTDAFGGTHLLTKWTQAGRLFIYDLLKNRYGVLPVCERDANA